MSGLPLISVNSNGNLTGIDDTRVGGKAHAVVRPRQEFDALLAMERTPCWQEAGGGTNTDSGAGGTA